MTLTTPRPKMLQLSAATCFKIKSGDDGRDACSGFLLGVVNEAMTSQPRLIEPIEQ